MIVMDLFKSLHQACNGAGVNSGTMLWHPTPNGLGLMETWLQVWGRLQVWERIIGHF